jgi:ribose/xylose/arabinose/galactoside ABC-type transport system permease subunit
VWPYRHAGAGRREFGRLVLASLADAARIELDTHRARGRRLRARRAERRLAELEEALERLESGAAPFRARWYARPGAEAATTLALLASLAALVTAVVTGGAHGVLVGVLDVAMLAATLAWFAAAVAGRSVRRRAASPPNEGWSPADGGR